MGAEESTPYNNREYKSLLANYYRRKSYDDPRYGQCSIWSHNHNPDDTLLVKEKWTNTKQEADNLNDLVHTRRSNNSKNLAKLKAYDYKHEDHWCSTFFKHKMAFEYYERSLEMELDEKNRLEETDEYSKYFSEPEVWYVFDSLMTTEKSFIDDGYFHGDIQPKNCLIDPHGFIKLMDNSLVNYGKTGYLKMLFDSGYTAILSPQLLRCLANKDTHPTDKPLQSEIFAIAMTTLCAALNKKMETYYDWEDYRLRYDRIKDSFEAMRNLGFSEQLISTLSGCLEESEDRRSTLQEVIDFLSPYQDQIKAGQFTFVGQNNGNSQHPEPMVGSQMRSGYNNNYGSSYNKTFNTGYDSNGYNSGYNSGVVVSQPNSYAPQGKYSH